jgi:hypothetical protein
MGTPVTAWGVILAALLGLPARALAIPTTFSFSGTVEGVCNFPPICNAFGLPIALGDPFTGQFSFDDTETPTDFRISFPQVSFVATDLSLLTQDFDGHIQFANLQGRIANGLFINIGLTLGFPARPDLFSPVVWDCAQWFLCGLQINESGGIAVEEGWLEINAIRALNPDNQSPEIFSIRAVPEPSTLLLLGSAAVLLLIKRVRGH